MGRSNASNPAMAHHRAQRQKELKKNRTARLKARDSKVVETRTLPTIQTEIDELEKKKKFQDGHLNSVDVRNLERLNKEFKIVKDANELKEAKEKEAAAEAKLVQSSAEAAYAKTAEAVQIKNEERYKYAKMSVYYDAVMNPYGAPPPGRPMVYHCRGGGTTMDVRMACLPPELVGKGGKEREDGGKEDGKDDEGDGSGERKRKRRRWDDAAPSAAAAAAAAANGTAPAMMPGGQPPIPPPPQTESFSMSCPQNLVGRIIGTKGSTIQDIRRKSGCFVNIRQELPAASAAIGGSGEAKDGAEAEDDGTGSKMKVGDATITIGGTKENVEIARKLIEGIMEEARIERERRERQREEFRHGIGQQSMGQQQRKGTELAWKKKIHSLATIPTKRAGTIRDVLISAITIARKAHLNDTLAALRSALQLHRPGAAGAAKAAALEVLRMQGGYEKPEGEDSDDESVDKSELAEVPIDSSKDADSSKVESLLCGNAMMLSGSLGGDEDSDRVDWTDAVRQCKTLSCFAALTQTFIDKADNMLDKVEVDKQILEDALSAWDKPGGKRRGSSKKNDKYASADFWANARLTQKFVMAKVNGFPMGVARECEAIDPSVA